MGDELVSSIGRGLLVLVGISRDDKVEDMNYWYVELISNFVLLKDKVKQSLLKGMS